MSKSEIPKNGARRILDAARRYNNSPDFLKNVYGIDSRNGFDGIIVAPSWTPDRIFAQSGAETEVIVARPGFESYEARFAGLHLA